MTDMALRFTFASAQVLWMGTLVALAVFVIERLFARSAAGRHAVHLAGLILTLLILPVAFVMAPGSASPGTATPSQTSGNISTASPVADLDKDDLRMPREAVTMVATVATASLGSREIPWQSGWERMAPWAAGAYLAGLIAMLARLLHGFAASARMRRLGEQVDASAWTSGLKKMTGTLGVRVQPVLEWSRDVAAPVIIGFAKPAILLPVALASRLTPEQVEAVLAHELAHLKRRDTWALAVQRVGETILFFHPAVWWMSRQMEVAREEACDDLVLAAGCDPADYAEALVICSECRLEREDVSVRLTSRLAATGRNAKQLRRRVLRLLGGGDEGAVRLGRTGWVLGLLLVGGMVVAVAAGSGGRGGDSGQESALVEKAPAGLKRGYDPYFAQENYFPNMTLTNGIIKEQGGATASCNALEFRFAPKPSDLDPSELDSCRTWLKAGRVGLWWEKEGRIAGRMPEWIWLPLADPAASVSRLVTGEYNGQKYLLVSDKPEEKMVSAGTNVWKIVAAEVTKDALSQPEVSFEMDAYGGELFARLTSGNVGKMMAIVVEGRIMSFPIIQSPITGRKGVITGRFTEAEAESMAASLRGVASARPAGPPDNAGSEVQASKATQAVAGAVMPGGMANADARQRFVAIEQFARLPEPEQVARLAEFYRAIPPRSLGMFVEGILSSNPHDILNRYQSGDAYDGNTDRWARQLADAVPRLSVEQVADNLKDRLWLDVASRARALWILKQHPNIVSNLMVADLESHDTNAIERAATVILALDLKTFTPRILSIWMKNDALSESVWTALLFSHDPAMVKPLLERVDQDPKFLIRCAGLFQGTLHNQPADPVLLKLLDSPDPEIRYHAAYALEECLDSRLGQPAVRLAGDTNSQSRFVAAHMAAKLPEASFQEARSGLLPLLKDTDEQVRYYALLSFGKRKDPAAGPVILEALRKDKLPEQYKVWVMQSMSALSGSTWSYYMHEWGPSRPDNQKAIDRFETWLKQQSPQDDSSKPSGGAALEPAGNAVPRPAGGANLLGNTAWIQTATGLICFCGEKEVQS